MPQAQINEITPEQKENFADELLVYMQSELEKEGKSIKAKDFDFHLTYIQKYFNAPNETVAEGLDLTKFKNIVSINDETFQIVMNYCFTHQYVKQMYAGTQKFESVLLTDSGFARATSVVGAKYKKPVTDTLTNIHIGSINGDNVQVGNNNTQNIESTFQYLIDEINKADATEVEKKNALNKLKEFAYNPIVSNILSAGTIEIIKRFIGA